MVIHLLSGPVRSGKTTRLQAWAATRSDVGGLLMPVSSAGRDFLDLRTGWRWPTAARPGELHPLRIGHFYFSPPAFFWAESALRGAAEAGVAWLVVDEVGPLELRGQGLAAALSAILESGTQPAHLVLVVRASLVEAVCRHFRLHRWTLGPFRFPE